MFNFFEYKINISEFITGNSFIDIADKCDAFFCKTDYISNYKNNKINILITHNSDYHVTNTVVKNAPKFDYWFAQNKDTDNNKIISIPIGLENIKLRKSLKSNNSLFSSEVNGALHKSLLIDKINSYDIKKNKLVYLNFNVNTYPTERQYVMNKFKNENWVTYTNNLSIEQFYFDFAQHKFIFSPRGNGIDCHRTWEALYLGVIPIVKKSIHMNEFADLPILFLDEWDEINEEILHNFYEQVKCKLYNLDKLKISYWEKIINNS